jgi:Domain of unknown function (DUF4279)
MATVGKTRASLRIFGDDLDPDEISELLSASPTLSGKKGEVRVDKRGLEQTATTGRWLLRVARRQPGDLDSQLVELLSPLTPDIGIWRNLVARFKADIFCGLFLKESNEGLEIRPETLKMIGSRGLSLGFDIYGAPPEEADESKGETS